MFVVIGEMAHSEQNIIHSEEPKPTHFFHYDKRTVGFFDIASDIRLLAEMHSKTEVLCFLRIQVTKVLFSDRGGGSVRERNTIDFEGPRLPRFLRTQRWVP